MARYWNYYKKSTPREAKGGIKAQSKSGGFARSWWGKQWQAVIEGFHIGARLDRGRNYARRGQVLSIEIEKGMVRAKVQGSRSKPYQVDIEIKPIPKAGWKKLTAALSGKAVFAAKLLAGEMPEELEQEFQDAGYSLFPKKRDDLDTDCSCPDWSNPCKHIAAVYYLIAEELDRDPFLLLRLRGMEREELLAAMDISPASKTIEPDIVEEPSPPEPLPPDPDLFWKGPQSSGEASPDEKLPEVEIMDVLVPPVPAVLARRLGPFPFWRAREKFLPSMELIYTTASRVGFDVWSEEMDKPSGEV